MLEAPIELEKTGGFGFPFQSRIELPHRCAGMLMVFETKSHARKYYGRNVDLIEIRKADVKPHR
jgi:hypothetical protein